MSTEGESSPLPPKEEALSKEQVLSLPGQIHDHCVQAIQDSYAVGPQQDVYLYHTYHDQDGTPGHIETVRRVAGLYNQAVIQQTKQKGLSYPDSTTDPLGVFTKGKEFIQQHAFEGVPLPADDRLMQLIAVIYDTSARMHDMVNVATDVDWKNISPDNFEQTVTPAHEMRSYFTQSSAAFPVEDVAAGWYRAFITQFQESLELSVEESDMVNALGQELIRNTYVKRGLTSEDPQLAFFDQVGALVSPNGYKEVWGLINEWEKNMRRIKKDEIAKERPGTLTEDVPEEVLKAFGQEVGMVNPTFLFKKFIEQQIDTFDKQHDGQSTATAHMFDLLEQYRANNAVQCAELMGVSPTDLAHINSLKDFLMDRLALRGEIVEKCWPYPGEDKVNIGSFFQRMPPYYYSFIQQSSKLFRDRFWDQTLSINDFQSLHAKLAV